MDEKYKKLINQAMGNEEEEKKDDKSLSGGFFGFILEVVKVVIISAIIVLPVRYFLIQPFFVSGASMQPQFYNGEYLIVDEITYRSSAPERGDVIVFRYPNDPSQFYIKRIIGLPGETVEIKNSTVTVFNKENPWGLVLDEPYLKPGEITRGDIYQKIDDNKYFVLGDNRQASSDSRVWGLVDKKYIIGKVWLRAWPPDKIKIFQGAVSY